MVILSDFINYFAPLSHGERTAVMRDQVWSGLRGHRRLARAARKRIIEHQTSEDAQVEQDESLTRNNHRLCNTFQADSQSPQVHPPNYQLH
jgi:hypothetical protein